MFSKNTPQGLKTEILTVITPTKKGLNTNWLFWFNKLFQLLQKGIIDDDFKNFCQRL